MNIETEGYQKQIAEYVICYLRDLKLLDTKMIQYLIMRLAIFHKLEIHQSIMIILMLIIKSFSNEKGNSLVNMDKLEFKFT